MRITKRQLKRIIREAILSEGEPFYHKGGGGFSRVQNQSDDVRQLMDDLNYPSLEPISGSKELIDKINSQIRGQNITLREFGMDGLAFYSGNRMIIPMYDLEDRHGVVTSGAIDAVVNAASSVTIRQFDYDEYLAGYSNPKLTIS